MRKFKVIMNNKEYEIGVQELTEGATPVQEQSRVRVVQPSPRTLPLVRPPVALKRDNGQITAPIPGLIVSMLVQTGAKVNKGDTLLILEAMKLENEIIATTDGIVREVKVTEGQFVNGGEVLVVIEYD